MKYSKIFSITIALFTAFFLFGVSDIKAISVDTLIKGSETTVYYYAADGKRYVFPNEKTYKSWFTNYDRVAAVTLAELADMPLAGNITYRPGVRMVKIQTDPKVYAVSRNGALRWVKTEAIAEALYGSDWNQKIDDVPDAFFVNYRIGDTIQSVSDYNRETEMNTVLTINDDKGIAKSDNPPISDTGDIVPVLHISEVKVSLKTANSATIIWQTSVPSTSVVEYGTESLTVKAGETISFDELTRSHSVGLRGLKSGTYYFFRVSSEDTAGNIKVGEELAFETASLVWTGEVRKITETSATERSPHIIAIDSGYGAVWAGNTQGQNEVYFAAFDTVGRLVKGPYRVTNNTYESEEPSVAWNGTASGIVWEDRVPRQREIYFRKIDTYGNMPISETRITNKVGHAKNPRLVFDGTNFGITWWDSRAYGNLSYQKGSLYFARMDKSGIEIGLETKISNGASVEFKPKLIWNGVEYAAVWADDISGQSDIYFIRIDASGNKLGEEVKITETAADSLGPAMAWDGTNYGVVWQEKVGNYFEIYYQKLSSTGEKIGGRVRLTSVSADSEAPDIAWNGSQFGVVWADYRGSADKSESEIYFKAISSNGNVLEDEQNVSNAAGFSIEPAITSLGSGFGILWVDYRDGNYEIYSTARE